VIFASFAASSLHIAMRSSLRSITFFSAFSVAREAGRAQRTWPDAVQVGGVFTPQALRGRGYARAVVAGSLLEARGAGAARAILFTPRPDAVAAYRAVGFEQIGRYAVVLFAARP
jgi:predicted GNAT family acetyltransferase